MGLTFKTLLQSEASELSNMYIYFGKFVVAETVASVDFFQFQRILDIKNIFFSSLIST